MRTLLLALFLLGPAALYGQSRKLSVSLSRQPLDMLFRQIEDQCGYHIVYSDDVVPDTATVSLSVTRMPVSQVLAAVLPQKQLFHRLLSDNLIVIGSTGHAGKDDAPVLKTGIGGKISDQRGQGIPFASVGLFEGTRPLGGGIGTEDGGFRLSYPFETGNTYLLKVSSVGYRPAELSFTYPDTAALKNIRLSPEQNTLQTVTVTANRPLIERKSDRYVVNVEGSVLGSGNNGLEVLQKSPGIWVGADGSIRIRGNQSVMVMINDVVQRMSEADLAELLRTLRSEDISKIEIISNPPSEFEAAGSGGIIHIILKKSRRDGLTGSLSSQYRQLVKRPEYNAGTTLNYKIKNLYVTGSLSGGRDKSDYIASTKISYPNQDYYASNTDRFNNNSRWMYRLGLAYDLDTRQSIGIQSIQTINKLNQYFDTYIGFTGSQPLTGLARSEWFRKPFMNGTTLNYSLKTDTLGSVFKIIGDYVYSTKTELNNFSSVYSYTPKNSTFRNNTPNTTNLYSVQADHTQVLRKALSFKTGVKFAATKRDNEVLNEDYIAGNWVVNTGLSNRFIYKEYLLMGYASLEKTWGKLNIKAGLRAEYTNMHGNSVTANQQFRRDYLNLFPSVFISQNLDEKKGSSVFLNYSRRLRRPSFADLNPYRLHFDNYLTQLGNPNLMPEYIHNIQMGAVFFKGWSAEVYYALTTDRIAQLANPVSGNIIEYQNRNFNSSNEYGISVYAPVTVMKGWTTNNSFAAYNLQYTIEDYRIRQNTFFARTQHTIVIPKIFDLDAGASYRSSYVRANTTVAELFYADFGISKRLYNRSLLLRFAVSDIFNTWREKDYTEYEGTRIDFYQKRPTRSFGLSLNYTFSSGRKFSNKRIEQSNDEEKGRIGN